VTCADGPIDGYSLRSWRDRIAFVPQSLQLFGGTLRDNLRIADKEASDERIREAFVRAGADDLFDVLPAGLDTVIGEGGSTLSGGQARRVMLARAALRSAPILLLDEPFAGLDPESRKSVAAAIRNVGKGRTIIIVTHEALDLVRPDVVLRIEHGRLAEAGIA
jgi:ABC-type multidrug transport system fused ATPase/permease subunit